MSAYTEDLAGAALPAWAEEYLAGERTWNQLLRRTGAVSEAEMLAELWRRMDP
jgi:hypothetical protein